MDDIIEHRLTHNLLTYLKQLQNFRRYKFYLVLLTEPKKTQHYYYLSILVHGLDWSNHDYRISFNIWFKRYKKFFKYPVPFDISFNDSNVITITTITGNPVDITTIQSFNDYEKRTRTN